MALVNTKCKSCGRTEKKLIKPTDQKIWTCVICAGTMVIEMGAPASTRKMTVDNGQSRAVEVHPDIVDLRKEWSKPRND